MIIQGSNNPLVIQFDADVSGLAKLVATLWGRSGTPLKTWTLSDMSVSGDTAICPITEDETAKLSGMSVTLEVKGLDGSDNTVFWDSVDVDLKQRRDRIIKLTGA